MCIYAGLKPFGGGLTCSPNGVWTMSEDIQPKTFFFFTHDITGVQTAIDQKVGTVNVRRIVRSHLTRLAFTRVQMCKKGQDAQKTTALACSTASPNRPIGTWFIRLPSFSGVLRKSISNGVRIGPLMGQPDLDV